jgi:hypothetical protein
MSEDLKNHKGVIACDDLSRPYFCPCKVFHDALLVPADRCSFGKLKHFDYGFESGS